MNAIPMLSAQTQEVPTIVRVAADTLETGDHAQVDIIGVSQRNRFFNSKRISMKKKTVLV